MLEFFSQNKIRRQANRQSIGNFLINSPVPVYFLFFAGASSKRRSLLCYLPGCFSARKPLHASWFLAHHAIPCAPIIMQRQFQQLFVNFRQPQKASNFIEQFPNSDKVCCCFSGQGNQQREVCKTGYKHQSLRQPSGTPSCRYCSNCFLNASISTQSSCLKCCS